MKITPPSGSILDGRQQDTSTLLWGLLFSSIGLGFFLYGKKQRAIVPLVCGLALMIYPYFVGSSLVLVAVGVVLVAIPYFVRL
jgi:hypothetical protein